MKKKISLKLFFTVLCGGIWNVIKWVVGMCGYKDGSTFGRVIKRIFALCVTILLVIITCAAVYSFATEIVYKELIRPHTEDFPYAEQHISNHIVVQTMCYSEKTHVYDEIQEKVLLKDVDWVITSDDNDSLAVFARNNKRGYLNRFTGEVVIPETFTRAWTFAEGLAAVEKDGELVFINHKGEVVIDKDFDVNFLEPAYTFNHGYCILQSPVTGKSGLIDRTGEWVLSPEYDDITYGNGFWEVSKDGLCGLYTADIEEMFPVNNHAIYIIDDIIEVRHADHIARRYDLQGNMVVDFVIDAINNLRYETNELRYETSEEEGYEFEETSSKYAIANCKEYKVTSGYYNEYYGLISKDGIRITPPLYTSITAIAPNRYLCQPDGIILDDNGKVVE